MAELENNNMFSLRNYLLNEALSSDTLQNDILNEPSGFFRYIKIGNEQNAIVQTYNDTKRVYRHSIYADCQELIIELMQTLKAIFGFSESYSYGKYNIIDLCFESYMNEKPYLSTEETPDRLSAEYAKLSDAELIKINKTYLGEVEKLYKKEKNLFNRPNGQVLASIFHGYVRDSKQDSTYDLMSISDSHFKKYTFTDIKNDKDGIKSLLSDNKKTIYAFYFNADGYMLGITKAARIYIVNPLIKNTKSGIVYTEKFQKLQNAIENFDQYSNVENVIKTKCNNSDKILYWPILKDYTYSSETPYNLIRSGLLLNQLLNHYSHENYQYVNKDITYAASNLRQQLYWGYNKNDYVIIYTPDTSLSPLYRTDSNYDFTDVHNKALSTARSKNYMSAVSTANNYQWKKDALYRIQPYRIGGNSITVFDKDENKYKLINPNDPDFKRLKEKYNIVFSNNPDEYVKIARADFKRKLDAYKKIKGDDSFLNQYKNNVHYYQLKVADLMKELQPIEKSVRKVLLNPRVNTQDISELKKLLFGASESDLWTKTVYNSNISSDGGIQPLLNYIIGCIDQLNKTVDKIISNMSDSGNYHEKRKQHIANITSMHGQIDYDRLSYKLNAEDQKNYTGVLVKVSDGIKEAVKYINNDIKQIKVILDKYGNE